MADVQKNTQARDTRYILVVENSSSELFYTSLLLQRFEYQVCSASDSGHALEMLSVAVPALIITDMVLPGMSGMDLLRLIRQDPRTGRVPIIFLVPAQDRTSRERCLNAGAAGCLEKPVQAEDLFRIVQAAIEPIPRGNIRIQTRLAVSVNNIPLDCIEGECASVLSEHGMYVRMLKPYPRNERVSVCLNINGRTIAVVATVLYCHTFGEGPFKEPGMGLKFTTITPGDREYINRFINDEVTRGIVPVPS